MTRARAHRKAMALALVLPLIGGCSAWRGELSPEHNRSVEQHVRDIAQNNLRARSRQNPVTIDEDMPRLRDRIASTRPAGAASSRPAGTPATQPAMAVLEATGSVAGDPGSSTGLQPLRLSIADLRMHALHNNLDLDVIALEPALARTQISEEEAKFDATFFGGFGYKKTNPPRLDGPLVDFDSKVKEIDGKTAKLTEIEQTKEALSFDYGIEVPLPTGAKVKLRNVFEENNKLEPKRSEQYVTGLKFSVSQPLLRGAGIDANVASIRLARLGSQAVSAKTKLSAIRVLALAEKVYWNLYGAQRILDVRAQQYNLAFENLEMVRRRVAEGLSAQIEIVRGEVGVTSRLESLIMADTSLKLYRRDLKRILNIAGLDLNSDTPVDVTSSPDLVRLDLQRDALQRDALANRMEMLELELNLAADAIKIDLARNQALPLFVVDFDYGIMDRQGSFGTGWQGMWDFDNSEFAVAVRAEIPVTNEARKARLRRAMITRSQRLATRRQREIAIRQEVSDALDILNQNWQRILAARQNVIVSGVNYEAELKQFKQGARTMREVLEALTSLGEAQLKEVQAVVSYQVSQIDLAFATGTLLGYSSVGLEPLPLVDSIEGAADRLQSTPMTTTRPY